MNWQETNSVATHTSTSIDVAQIETSPPQSLDITVAPINNNFTVQYYQNLARLLQSTIITLLMWTPIALLVRLTLFLNRLIPTPILHCMHIHTKLNRSELRRLWETETKIIFEGGSTVSDQINTPLKNNHRSWVAHN